MRGSTATSAACARAAVSRLRRASDLRRRWPARRAPRPARRAAGSGRAWCRCRARPAAASTPGKLASAAPRRGSRRSTAPRCRRRARRPRSARSRRASAASRGDEVGVGHRAQHDVAALLGALAVDERRVIDTAIWMTPAISAASASVRLLTSLPKKMRAASATPCSANEPRLPR